MNPYFLLGSLVAVIAAAGAGYFQGSEHGKSSVQAMWDKEKAAQYAEYAKAQEEARKKEQELQANADQLRQEKDREIKNLNARATALTNSLQHRPTRTSEAGSVSDTSKSCSGASGKELARGDAEFLVWYATEAARLQADLNQCIRQYEALRK
jgi:alkanesulfonate monooxygenase SsuD/methylene tetrahydromethanopterin reductase-like flavin-dependent oxidoreductase (luciferase family)